MTIVVNDLGARKSIPLYSVDGRLMIQFLPSVQIGDSIYRLEFVLSHKSLLKTKELRTY